MSGIETKNYKAGEIIYSINDAADKIYLIHNGTVRVKSKLGLNLAVLKEGEMFGEVGPIIEEPRTVTVIAETNCTLREIEHSTLHKKLEGGVDGETLIKLRNKRDKKIKDVEIYDRLINGETVLGLIEIDASNIDKFIIERMDENILLTDDIKRPLSNK